MILQGVKDMNHQTFFNHSCVPHYQEHLARTNQGKPRQKAKNQKMMIKGDQNQLHVSTRSMEMVDTNTRKKAINGLWVNEA